MTRTLREWHPGACYHIMQRGIRRREIFAREEDFQMFLVYLKKELERYGCTLHAYCLMTNHFHLLLQTSNEAVWRPMKNLSHNYAQYYNAQYAYHGHLFEGRYVSCLVEDNAYFLLTSRYIHLNPVKARMVGNPEDYKWSSYRTIVGMGDDSITDIYKTLALFKEPRRIRYRNFVEDAGHKYSITDDEIHLVIEKDEYWLPW